MTTGIKVAHVTAVDLTHRFLLLGQLRDLRDRGYVVTAISAPGPFTDDLESGGIRHIPWPHITRSMDPRADLRAMLALIGILRRERFDIVHTHNPKPGVMGRIAARIAGVPHVVNTVHGLYATPEDRWVKRLAVLAIEAIAARFSDHELYQSAEDLRWVRRARIVSAGRADLLGNGTDLQVFNRAAVPQDRVEALRRELSIGRDAIVVGVVGRLVAEKGYHEFFAAAERIRANAPAVRFLTIGASDPDKPDAISPEDIERAAEGVVFAGWRTDVRDLMALMDVFVLPSWREGLPRSAVEASAMALPMVLTDIRGCRDVVRNGVEGLLVPPRDATRLAEAIALLVDDPELRARMGAAARARAEQEFDEKRVFSMIAATYERLLGRAQGLGQEAGDLDIRRAEVRDAGALARLHGEALPHAFLPTLGHRFLRRLYRALITNPDAVTIVAEDRGAVVGFSAAVRSVRAFYGRFLIRDGIPAGLMAAPYLVRPGVLRRAFETARYPTGGTSRLPDAELLAIAVDSEHRANGVGKRLFKANLTGLAELGVCELKVVVASANQGANRFYKGLGFRHALEMSLHDGAASNVWTYSLDPLIPGANEKPLDEGKSDHD